MKIRVALVFPTIGFFDNVQESFLEHCRTFDEISKDINCQYILEERAVPSSQFTTIEAHDFDYYDAIISRGITCELLRKALTNIPVIDIPVSGNDIIYCLKDALNNFGNQLTAVVGNHSMIMGTDRLAKIMNINVRLYYRYSLMDVKETVDMAYNDGCKVLIGGVETCSYASSLGMKTLIIRTGNTALWYAFSEMKKMVRLHLQQQQKTELLKTVVDYSLEGIIQIDVEQKILLCNHTAKKILNIKEEIVGKGVYEVLGNNRLTEICADENSYFYDIITYSGKKLIVNKVPVRIKNSSIYHIVSFQDITQVQNTEKNIRERLKNMGWVAKYTFKDIIGESTAIKSVIKQAKKYSKIDSDILIIGQSGTGKELFSQSIHNSSKRCKGPFVAINCAAISESLIESELFGYVKGAFTGAQANGKVGLFEQAHTGTIFLDEIGEISLSLQSKLLRVIQEREIMRLGDNRILPVDIRIIAATNKNLFQQAMENRFRLDLYYRLDGLRLTLPPINERGDDVGILAEHLLQKLRKKYHLEETPMLLTDDAKELLKKIKWYGNIRQLNNLCLRIVANDFKGKIDISQIKQILNPEELNSEVFTTLKNTEIESEEAKLIRRAMQKYSDNRNKVAEELGISRSTLWRKLKQYGLK
ncbi:arginine utilization regulatory protein RocR [Clostridium homopropionicum DSM 5847]|uniref:Arginine utilization regulatory protein RocR n=1 Tax=Clostridium homopropionicum DSM 5847 TaxID=1121318 RepID=A0A0L6Z9S8_9CLOT|nr:sigma 54-interacting transcriptional regulator [Clostridium homopropionicum]KOA19722.1 arginine utilization regulatory protein RocR [Clostridium homopropionicum DSM 5847]SFF79060.1 Transcriptional regulator containing PAS, AAA-type ATPase, and DNA-binding Fis domains [Clostridium homopropionicum]